MLKFDFDKEKIISNPLASSCVVDLRSVPEDFFVPVDRFPEDFLSIAEATDPELDPELKSAAICAVDLNFFFKVSSSEAAPNKPPSWTTSIMFKSIQVKCSQHVA